MSSIPDVINCVSHLAEYCGETDRSLRKLLNAQRAWRNFERGMSCLRLGTLPEKTENLIWKHCGRRQKPWGICLPFESNCRIRWRRTYVHNKNSYHSYSSYSIVGTNSVQLLITYFYQVLFIPWRCKHGHEKLGNFFQLSTVLNYDCNKPAKLKKLSRRIFFHLHPFRTESIATRKLTQISTKSPGNLANDANPTAQAFD